jgi:putative hydrolase of the HAD superfamily
MKRFRSIFIDLDETLYPKSNGIWNLISKKINEFITHELKLPLDSAIQLRQQYLDSYGTTLMGLRENHDIDPHKYLKFVHDIPLDEYLGPNPILASMLSKITAKRIIFTNASAEHAQRIIRLLEIEDFIDQIVDIIALDFCNKPNPEAYKMAFELSGTSDPKTSLMVDDRIDNLHPAHDMQITTVLVGSDVVDEKIDYTVSSITDLINAVPDLA